MNKVTPLKPQVGSGEKDFVVRVGERRRVVPSGQYRAKVVRITKVKNRWKRDVFTLHFEVCEGPHSGIALTAFLNAHYESFSEYTKLRRWHMIVSGDHHLEPGSEIDLNDFMNRVLQVQVDTKASERTGNEFSNVIDVLSVVCEL